MGEPTTLAVEVDGGVARLRLDRPASANAMNRPMWFELRDADGLWRPVVPQTREAVSLGSTTVFVPARAELRTMFARFGRAKDHSRIALLDRIG